MADSRPNGSMEPNPNPWSLIKEYSQSVITLASALLAISVTFSATFIANINNRDKIFLIISWCCLVSVIAFGVASMGFLSSYLKNGKKGNSSIFCANTAFIGLLISGIFFLIFGWRIVYNNTNVSKYNLSVQKTLESMPKISGIQNSKWLLKSLTWNESLKIYELIVIEDKSLKKFLVIVNDAEGKIIQLKEVE